MWRCVCGDACLYVLLVLLRSCAAAACAAGAPAGGFACRACGRALVWLGSGSPVAVSPVAVSSVCSHGCLDRFKLKLGLELHKRRREASNPSMRCQYPRRLCRYKDHRRGPRRGSAVQAPSRHDKDGSMRLITGTTARTQVNVSHARCLSEPHHGAQRQSSTRSGAGIVARSSV